MALIDELKQLIGKPAWLNGNVLEIRKSSDAQIIDVEGDRVVMKHFLGQITFVPISVIWSINRKDLM
jgi:hypothetical protein